MDWARFCELTRIGAKYRNASIDTLKIPDDDRGSYSKKADYLARNPTSCLLLGPSGRGKTHFMLALIHCMFNRQIFEIANIRFFRSIDLDAKLMSEFEQYKSCENFIRNLAEIDYLFIDDFGIDRNTEKAERDYYDLLDRRLSDNKVTILSSNLDEAGIKKIFGERIASRLKEYVVIEFNGPDLREGVRL